MAFTSRRLFTKTLTYSSYSPSPSPSPSPPPSPSPSPSPSPLPSDGIVCPDPCDPYCSSFSNCPRTYSSPPPPSYDLSSGRSPRLSTPIILAVSLVSSLFLLTGYLILLVRSRRNRNPHNRGPDQGPLPPPGDGGQWGEGEEWNQNQAMVHPIWLINTVGLQPAVIGSIAVCEYKKGEGLIEGDYCSICLSDFEEGESLRLLPKCSHAFHIPCIDTWLRSHINCPLCRSPILAPALASSSVTVLETAGSGSGRGEDVGENTEGGDTAGDDTGDASGAVEGVNGEEGLGDKSDAEEVWGGASVGRRSVSVGEIASAILNVDGEGNRRGRVGGVQSLPGSGRFCRPRSDS